MTWLTIKKQGQQSRTPGPRHPEVMKLGFVCALLSLLAGEAPAIHPAHSAHPPGPRQPLHVALHTPASCACPLGVSASFPSPSILLFTDPPLSPSPCLQETAGQTPEPLGLRNATPTRSPGRQASSSSPTSSAGRPSSVTAGCSQLPTATSRE